jgi:RNA polymerase primary sigma factor
MKRLNIKPSITNRDAIKSHLKDVAKIPLLSLEEEKELGKRAKEGDKEAQNQLVIHNLRFVISVAKQYQHQGLPLEDLISAGHEGLIIAAQKYDVDRVFKFISYAVWWIRQSILKALYSSSRTIRLPLNQIGNVSKVLRAIKNFEQKYERTPTLEELETIVDIPQSKIGKLIEYSKYTTSLDSPLADKEDSNTLEELLASPEKRVDEELITESEKLQVSKILNLLKDREHDILRMYFGIGVPKMHMTEISKFFGISSERVRQLKDQALTLLKTTYLGRVNKILNA